MADEDSLRAALADDLDASFERLVRAYQGRLFSFALRWSGSREDAEEIAQDALVRAYRALRGYPAERVLALALRPWLYRIALNVARNRARGRRLPVVRLAGAEEGADDRLAPVGAVCAGPEALVERAERRSELGAALARLPARYRAAVILRYVEGLAYAELADVLGQPVGTAKSDVHRGIRLLRKALANVQAE